MMKLQSMKWFAILGSILFLGISVSTRINALNEMKNIHSIISDNTFYVGGSGVGNYSSIQKAIDNASDGDIIFVYSGIYFEHLEIISKSLVIQGEQKEATIVDAKGTGTALLIQNADNIIISGFTFQNISGLVWLEAGICLNDSHGCIIKDNIICNCGHGIFLYRSSDIAITQNILIDNKEGIIYYDTDNNTIKRNNIENSSIVGIYLNGCKSVSISENNFINNKRHLTLFGALFVDVNANYWERLINWKIKPLLLTPFTMIPIPILIFDWHSTKKPYDISETQP